MSDLQWPELQFHHFSLWKLGWFTYVSLVGAIDRCVLNLPEQILLFYIQSQRLKWETIPSIASACPLQWLFISLLLLQPFLDWSFQDGDFYDFK